jgi:signal transduction histidine kinase
VLRVSLALASARASAARPRCDQRDSEPIGHVPGLESHVTEQQRFAANASHELRTPLAISQTLLDVARNDLNRDTGELVDRRVASR